MNHEAKCAHVHGHRGDAEITVAADKLDDAGRVIDFSVIKQLVGGFIDSELDHGFICNPNDKLMRNVLTDFGQKHFVMPSHLAEPSAENIARLIYEHAGRLLSPKGVLVNKVRFYETPNNWADAQ